MIKIKHKEDCCGCTACQQVCPKSCISMHNDEQGFAYPRIDSEKCIDCHLCEKVCPVINQYMPKESPMKCYLAKSRNDDVRSQSSSGGIFTELAKYTIEQKGVVFGVRFNERWQAVYDFTETMEGVDAFRGSKYVQADINSSYAKVKEYLKAGRLVLFSGTPCYVSGLNHFLKEEYPNLLTIDIVCHSIPSPKIWQMYLGELEQRNNAHVTDVTFRDKSNGWSNYSLGVRLKTAEGNECSIIESHFENVFSRGFADDIITRPSCSQCPARNYKSNSDITIADAWAINKYHPQQNDEKGISHIMLNTNKGIAVFSELLEGIDATSIPYYEVEPNAVHAPITQSCPSNPLRTLFYKRVNKGYLVIDTLTNIERQYKKFYQIFRIYRYIRKKINR